MKRRIDIRHFKIVTLLIPLLLVSCIKDSLSGCAPELLPNTTINFSLRDGENKEVFNTRVESVELFIYNQAGLEISREYISKKELTKFAGKRLYLEPGVYNVVAWGNTTQKRSKLVTNQTVDYRDRVHNYLLNAIALSDGSYDTGDPLYYAPTTKELPMMITVPTQGSVESTANFTHAHINVEILVKGYKPTTRAVPEPVVLRLTDITSRFSFEMATHGQKVDYRQLAPCIDEAQGRYKAGFIVPLFDRATPTMIELSDQNGAPLIVPIVLKDLIDDSIDLNHTIYIPIEIEFPSDGSMDVDISVNLPGWGEGIVTPEQ